VKVWLDEGHDVLLGHLSQATVVRGQRVEIGTLVGYVGDLGVADIPNLDFGARPHGGGEYDSIDPAPFLAFLDLSQTSESNAGRYLGGQIQLLARSEADGSTWSMDLAGIWTATPGGPFGGFVTEPVVAGDGRGHLIAFAAGVDGAIWMSSQATSPAATPRWHVWISLGRPAATASRLIGQPAVGLGPDGRLHVFVRAVDGTVWEAQQSRAGGPWSRWDRTPFASEVAGDPVVATDSSGAMEAFVTSKDGRILVNRQTHGGGRWTSWLSLGRPAGGDAGFSGPTAVVRDGAGLLEAFVVTANGSVFTSTQSKVGRWTPWTQLGWRSDSAVAAALRPDHSVQVFALNRSGAVLTTIRKGRRWAPWTTLGHGLSGGIATTFGANGSLLVLSSAGPQTFVFRSGDPQQFDVRSAGPLEAEFAEARAQAWTSLPLVPSPISRPVSL
jgi:hypothetical protein